MAIATTSSTSTRRARGGPVPAPKLLQLNWLGGQAGRIWLAKVVIPL
jgi:raffinose/stachyose/melibiose transport system permease protein